MYNTLLYDAENLNDEKILRGSLDVPPTLDRVCSGKDELA